MLFGIPYNIIFYVLAVLLVILLVWIIRMEMRLKRLLRGKSGADLEETLVGINKELSGIANYRKHIDAYLETVEKRLRRAIRGIATIRFNPFPDKGGNQSFASAFLNEEGDGVVISTLAARDKVGVYAKPVKDNQSTFELSAEEKQAIEEASK